MKRLIKYKNGNTVIDLFDDGTRIIFSNDDEFKFDYPTNIDVKITNYCTNGCPFCHEKSDRLGTHANLSQDWVGTLHPGQEIAIGGGNPLSHPDIESFLHKLKSQGVFANITVHQNDFIKNFDKIKLWSDNKVLYGVGISVVDPNEEFLAKSKEIPNIVQHVINGILTQEMFNKMSNLDNKILILGYKNFGRGLEYKDKVNTCQEWLRDEIKNHSNKFSVISFDNLAIEQLRVKELVSKEVWNTRYAGEEGTQTFYIDMVSRTFSKSSVDSYGLRLPLMNTVKDMFEKVKSL